MTSKMGYDKKGKQPSSDMKMSGKKSAERSGKSMKSAQAELPGPRKA